jgi:hypothetical protein
MYKFKPCVCDNFTVNYAPGGRAAFYRNGTGTVGDNPPAQVQIVAHFIELEFWIEGNVTDSNNPDDVYNQAPNTSQFAGNVTQIVDAITSLAHPANPAQQQQLDTQLPPGG